ncbi:MAG: ABC transporter substrate-binding protein [Chloroflexota bacterium]
MKQFTLLLTLFMLLMPFTISAQDDAECDDGFRLVETDEIEVCIPEDIYNVPYSVDALPAIDPVEFQFELIEANEETLIVRDSFGEKEIPRNPQRIVATVFMAEPLLRLGIEPVAIIVGPDLTVPEIIEDSGVPLISSGQEVNPEAILSYDPDLIIGKYFVGDFAPDAYDQLVTFAPILSPIKNPTSLWRLIIRDLGILFDKEAEAEEILTEYAINVATLRQEIVQVIPEDETVGVLFFFPGMIMLTSPVFDFGDGVESTNFAWIYNELGLTFPSDLADLIDVSSAGGMLSLELLPELESVDHITLFPTAFGSEVTDEFLDAMDSPIWLALPAVQNEQAYTLTGANAWGISSNLQAITDLLGVLTSE